MSRVAVFGLGYVGCVSAACLARDGHTVVGADVDPAKVAEVNDGRATVLETDLPELVREQVRAGRLRATGEVGDAIAATDLAFVTVGTPSAADGGVDLTAVERVTRDIAAVLRRTERFDYPVVVRSTLLPGLLEDRLTPVFIEALGRPGKLLNHPEFLREGSAIRDYDDPPFVVVGAEDPADAAPVMALYDRVGGERIVTDPRTAAMVKYACNAFHAVKVAFANEIGGVAAALGADGHAVMDIVCRDHKLNVSPAYLRPGFAFGGSCLPKDVRAVTRLAEQRAIRLPLLQSVLPSNEAQIERAVRRVRESGSRRIGVVGLSFKAGTDDLRESPLVTLVETLLGRGFELMVYDPAVEVSRLRGRNRAYIDIHLPHLAKLLTTDPAELLGHSELLILGTDVARGLDLSAFAGSVFDLRRDLARPNPS